MKSRCLIAKYKGNNAQEICEALQLLIITHHIEETIKKGDLITFLPFKTDKQISVEIVDIHYRLSQSCASIREIIIKKINSKY